MPFYNPEYINLLGTDNNQTHKLDVNAGLTLMGEDFYVGYAIHDLAKGRLITGDDYYKYIYPLHHVVQYWLSLQPGLVFQTGMQLSRFRLGYAREQASGQATSNAGTKELMLSYCLTPKCFGRAGKKLSVW